MCVWKVTEMKLRRIAIILVLLTLQAAAVYW